MMEKGGGRNAKANESTFGISARTAFPQLRVVGHKKSLKKTKNEKQNGNKLENLRLSLQVPFVEIETLSELTCEKNRKKVQLVKIFLPPEEHLKWV